ncbi:MAG: hypothetical protein ACREHE_15805 [Rhizomicrobium sp.]
MEKSIDTKVPPASTDKSKVTRILAGSVYSNGDIAGGSGFSVVQTQTGLYVVTFDTPFEFLFGGSATQAYGGSGGNGGSTLDNAIVVDLTVGQVKIKTGDGSGTATSRDFTFIFAGHG